MLDLWKERALSVSVPGKQELVDLYGGKSTDPVVSPRIRSILKKDIRLVSENFCFSGRLNGEKCLFRIDTGSDVSILNRKFAREGERGLRKEEFKIRYPTGEEVLIKFEEEAQIELGEFSLKFPLLVAEILDDCLLGVSFLKEIRLENIFEPIFGTPELGRVVAQIMDPLEGISSFLRSLLTGNLGSLLEEQKKDFANFLKEYQDIFRIIS